MSVVVSTYAALLTPPGRGAVAVIALRGPEPEAFVSRYFLPANRRALDQQPLGRIVFGRWGHDAGEEIVVCRLASGHIELHCHGGLAPAEAILRDLHQAGCEERTWQDVLQQDSDDEISAAACTALAHARTPRTAGILLDQFRGALRNELARLDDLAASSAPAKRNAAREGVNQLLERADLGRRLTTPYRVAIAGEPNVGKSSLINALVGYQRAIVFDQPGTTRDVVTATTALDGWPVELADTAGLRTTSDPLEAAGMARAEEHLAQADLIVLVLDITAPDTPLSQQLQARFPEALRVYNKADLSAQLPHGDGLLTSALSGQGWAELQAAIVARLVPTVPPPGAAVPFEPAQVRRLEALQAMLAEASAVRP